MQQSQVGPLDESRAIRRSPASVAAVIVAGGRSSRMGQDKASLVLAGRTLLDRVVAIAVRVPRLVEVIVVAAPGQRLPPVTSATPITIVRDEVEGQGPFPAIVRGVRAVKADVVLVLGCDGPFVRPALLELLARRAEQHMTVVPMVKGRPQPLCSALRADARPKLEALLASGNERASTLADLDGALRLLREEWQEADPGGLSFIGVNTPDDLVRAEAIAARLDAAHPQEGW